MTETIYWPVLENTQEQYNTWYQKRLEWTSLWGTSFYTGIQNTANA